MASHLVPPFRILAILFTTAGIAGCTGGEVPAFGEVKAWSFTDVDGATHSSNDSRGHPTLLFFMATWCTKCQSTAPRLAEVHHEFMARDVDFFTLSHDPTEDAEDLRAWQAKYQQPWPHGVDAESTMAKAFGITRQSSIVILDEDGAEDRKWIYAVPGADELRTALVEAGA